MHYSSALKCADIFSSFHHGCLSISIPTCSVYMLYIPCVGIIVRLELYMTFATKRYLGAIPGSIGAVVANDSCISV